jgi:hypothetical protein
MKTFENHRHWNYRALQIYLVLIGAASNKQILTYGDVARTLEFGGSNILGTPLGMIHYWCEHHGLPPINTLVVNRDTGIPGQEIPPIPGKTINEVHQAVFQMNWYMIMPPEPTELGRIYAANRS